MNNFTKEELERIVGKKDNPQKTFSHLEKENAALRKRSHLSFVGMIGMAALSALSIFAYEKKSNELDKTKRLNEIYAHNISKLYNESFDSMMEIRRLKEYEDLVNAMHPFYANVMDEATAAEEKAIQKDNAKEEKRWYDAADVLGLDTAEFYRLKGIER